MALIYGILAWPLVGRVRARAASTRRNRWRWLGWGLAAGVVVGSLLAADEPHRRAGRRGRDGGRRSAPRSSRELHRAGALPLDPDRRRRGAAADPGAPLPARTRSTARALFRMNTVFKAGYQAFLLLGLAAGCALPWAAVWLPRRALWTPWAAVAAVLLLLGLVYPYAGSYARTGGFANAPVARRPEVAASRARRATRARSTGCAPTRPATRSCWRPSATTTPRSATAASRPSPAAPTVIGWAGPRGPVAARPRHALGRRPDALHDARRRRRAAADRPLRHPLRRRRPDRADDLRRRRRSPSGTSSARKVYSAEGTTVWRSSSQALLDVEPFLHPARGVPDLALGDVAEQVAGA